MNSNWDMIDARLRDLHNSGLNDKALHIECGDVKNDSASQPSEESASNVEHCVHCEKKNYLSKKDAIVASKRQLRNSGWNNHVYECPYTDGSWHLTSQSQDRDKRHWVDKAIRPDASK
jgi:hypothetical protein